MDIIPGTAEDGTLNETELMEWIEQVRKLAVEKDRAVVADITTGAVLAHASNDPEDNAWPHRAVRGVIESLKCQDIERGLSIERFNMRGIYSKAIYEGGAQERALAARYREWANCVRAQVPRVACMLDTIAKGWEEQGRREDLQAEQRKLE
jgi:hypothetical protein